MGSPDWAATHFQRKGWVEDLEGNVWPWASERGARRAKKSPRIEPQTQTWWSCDSGGFTLLFSPTLPFYLLYTHAPFAHHTACINDLTWRSGAPWLDIRQTGSNLLSPVITIHNDTANKIQTWILTRPSAVESTFIQVLYLSTISGNRILNIKLDQINTYLALLQIKLLKVYKVVKTGFTNISVLFTSVYTCFSLLKKASEPSVSVS